MMKCMEFHNGLRLLRSINLWDLPSLSFTEYQEFRNSPYDFFIKCSDPMRDEIWAAMEKRMNR